MKQIVRYCLTALLILGGCTNETVLLPSSSSPSDTDTGGRTPLIIRATASGFINAGQPGDSPTTRTPVEDGLATKFQPGDAIGIFCVRTDEHTNEYISEDIKNLKLVYTQTPEGTGIWTTEEGTDGPVYYTDAQTYVAYSPYQADLGTNARNEEEIKEILRLQIAPEADQSTPEKYAKSDLMIASATPLANASGQQMLTLNFQHEYALIVVKPMESISYVPPAGETGFSYHSQAKTWVIDKNLVTPISDPKMQIYGFGAACEMEDGSFRVLTGTGYSDASIQCRYITDNGGLLPVDATGITYSSGFYPNRRYTLEVHPLQMNREQERALQPGDFVFQHNGKIEIYPNDGTVDPNGKIPDYDKAVGIVVTCDPARMTNADKASGWNHAYVMGLELLPGSLIRWGNENTPTSSLPTISGPEAGNDMSGYTYTETVLGKSDLSSFPIFAAIKTYRDGHTIPSGVSRSLWFIPSIGQWFDIATNIMGRSPADFESVSDAAWSDQTNAREMYKRIDSLFDKVGKTFLSNDGQINILWTSSQDSSPSWAWTFMGISTTTPTVMFIGQPKTTDMYSYTITAHPFFAF